MQHIYRVPKFRSSLGFILHMLSIWRGYFPKQNTQKMTEEYIKSRLLRQQGWQYSILSPVMVTHSIMFLLFMCNGGLYGQSNVTDEITSYNLEAAIKSTASFTIETFQSSSVSTFRFFKISRSGDSAASAGCSVWRRRLQCVDLFFQNIPLRHSTASDRRKHKNVSSPQGKRGSLRGRVASTIWKVCWAGNINGFWKHGEVVKESAAMSHPAQTADPPR